MTAKCVDGTIPRPASRTVYYSKLLTVRLIVNRSYNGVIKTLRAVCS